MNPLNLQNCKLCPRCCGVNRRVTTGYCNISAHPVVSAVFQHKGEEPVLSGIAGVCNVFFAHCNLQCAYCQNYQISRNCLYDKGWEKTVDDIVDAIVPMLDGGVRMLGFVSPSHQVVQMLEIIDAIKSKGYFPTIIYNTNCYDNVETLKALENTVDIYLPDFKYISNAMGQRYSGVTDYFDMASLALREMYRQKGSTLLMGDDGLADSGLIIRHLVLPGHSKESIGLLNYLAEEFSSRLHVSLMSQYYPPCNLTLDKPLDRMLSPGEYLEVLRVLDEIGFRGWTQSLDSQGHYQPDFSSEKPFVA